MSIPQFVDGETELDAVTLNRLRDAVLGSADYPIALPGIAEALGEYEPLQNMRAAAAWIDDFTGTAKQKVEAAIASVVDAGGGTVYGSQTTYALGANPAIVIPANVEIAGAGINATTFTFTSGTCFAVGDGSGFLDHAGIGNCGIDGPGAGTAGSIGLHIREGRFGQFPKLRVDDCETGVLIDGEDQWCDGNVFDKPQFHRNKYGIHITADNTYQANNTRVLGGGIYGNDPKTSGGIGILIERGDTNVIDGTDIEDYETGLRFTAVDAFGNSAVVPRIENCTNDIVIDSNVVNTILVGHKNAAIGGNGQMAQYGVRLQLPVEDVAVLGEDAFYYRGVLARIHTNSTYPDRLHLGATRANGASVWFGVPIIENTDKQMLAPVGLHAANVTDVTSLASGDVHLVYIGRPLSFATTCDIYTEVTTGVATITWAEIAVYRSDSSNSVRRCGYADVSATFNTTGVKTTTVALTDVMSGDDLWVAYGSAATTPFQLRALLPDAIESGVFRTLAARPSTTANFTNPSNQYATSGISPAWLAVRMG